MYVHVHHSRRNEENTKNNNKKNNIILARYLSRSCESFQGSSKTSTTHVGFTKTLPTMTAKQQQGSNNNTVLH